MLLRPLGRPGRFGHRGQDVAGLHGRAGRHRHRVDAARRGGHHHVLHLHGFEDHDGGPGAHGVPGLDFDPQHGPGEGRDERHRTRPSGCLRMGGFLTKAGPGASAGPVSLRRRRTDGRAWAVRYSRVAASI